MLAEQFGFAVIIFQSRRGVVFPWISENVLALAESLDNNQETLNSSLSLVLMQGAQCRTVWCQCAAFNWLESEGAFYNPDLDSSCIFASYLVLSDIKDSGQATVIFCNDCNQLNYLESERSKVIFQWFLWNSLISFWSLALFFFLYFLPWCS